MTKTIIDAVLGLSFDDTPSNLAAAALFYILTSDVSDFNCILWTEYVLFVYISFKIILFPPSSLQIFIEFSLFQGQDDHLMDSPSCIRFLIKLLKPLSSPASKEKALPVGSKLLGLCKTGFLQESAKGTDYSSTAIMVKVKEILVNCKEMKPGDDSCFGMEEPELNPKWISLLTLEKACLSHISIEGLELMLP